MEQLDQSELIRQFMVAVAPQVTSHSLEIGLDMSENATIVLECSLQLAAKYNALHETLTAAPQNTAETQDPDQAGERQTSHPTSGVRKAQTRIPIDPSDVPGVRRTQGGHHPSPESPTREPPSPYQ